MTTYDHDVDAEAAVLGIALYEDPAALPHALSALDPEDFHRPGHAAVWRAILRLHSRGQPHDVLAVSDQLRRDGEGAYVPLVPALAAGDRVPLASQMLYYVGIVVDNARRRVLLRATQTALDMADQGIDPDEIITTLTATLGNLDRPEAGQLPENLSTIADFLARPGEQRAPWVVPGLLRRDWRAVVVAPEGRGKSVLLRAVAGYAAQGVHPFTADEIPPVRALVVDLENPDEPLDDSFRRIEGTIPRTVARDSGRAWLWREPSGIDIRNRNDFRNLELVLQHTRPELVCLGPAYKLFTTQRGEDHEQVAGEVLSRLDSLRTRFGFGLLMEQHAPHGDSGRRDLRPFGSSTWLRWPELGLALDPNIDAPGWPFGHLLRVGRWRGDRVTNSWPTFISRGRDLLWRGHYDEGPPVPTADRRTP